MYQLFKDDTWDTFRLSAKPAQKVDATGAAMFERWPKAGESPRPLLDFSILPDRVHLTRHDDKDSQLLC